MIVGALFYASILFFPAPQDKEPDERRSGFLGVQLIDNGGVFIQRVEPGSPADKGGLSATDIILTIDAVELIDVNNARHVIGNLRPGNISLVAIRRGNQEITLKIKIGARPDFTP